VPDLMNAFISAGTVHLTAYEDIDDAPYAWCGAPIKSFTAMVACWPLEVCPKCMAYAIETAPAVAPAPAAP
jgi:hypothetical protein